MKIAQNLRFGPPEVVDLVQIDRPTPGQDEIMIKVFASSVSAGDSRLRSKRVPLGFGLIMGLVFGFKKPRYLALGTDASGEIVEVGKRVNQYHVGQRVLVNLGMKLGGHSQYIIVRQNAAIAALPDQISYETAAALPFGSGTALFFLRDGLKLKKGEHLLVIGAGGAVGSSAVQIGKAIGAKITAVCSKEKAAVVKAIGADHVITHDRDDWAETDSRYDVILDSTGLSSIGRLKRILAPKGRIGLTVANLPLMLSGAVTSLLSRQRVFTGTSPESKADLDTLLQLCMSGALKPIIGHTLPFSEIVRAHQIADSGHKLGTTLILPQA